MLSLVPIRAIIIIDITKLASAAWRSIEKRNDHEWPWMCE
jgi:hypothetical protein